MTAELTKTTTENQGEAILRALNLDPKDANTQALVLTCQRYGLDPLLKHAVLIQKALYVTRDGLLHVAHSSGKLDGIEVEALPETPTHFVARASVWRKDMSRPFVYQGRYPKAGRGGPGAQFGPEMAEKVAECRALRRAFSIALCSREEAWEEDAPAPRVIAPENVKPVIDDAQEARRSFYSLCDQLNVPMRTDGKPDPKKVMQVLHFLGWPQSTPPATGADWGKSEELLGSQGGEDLDRLRAELAPKPIAPAAPRKPDPVVGDLSDPFAEEG